MKLLILTSISKAYAKSDETVHSSGVMGVTGVADDSSSCRATSMAEATSLAADGAIRCFGGATTVGPKEMDSRVAVIELSRRTKRPPLEGATMDRPDMVNALKMGGGECSLLRINRLWIRYYSLAGGSSFKAEHVGVVEVIFHGVPQTGGVTVETVDR
jgi:hypothetical protein